MSSKNKLDHNQLFIKKQIQSLVSGDILLHPIYRADGLMLVKQYKKLSNDLILKIKHLVPGELPVIVLSYNCTLESFNENQYYNNTALIIGLEDVREQYSKYTHVLLEMNALIDERVTIYNSIQSINQINYTGDFYLNALIKSPFFSTFEKRLESYQLQQKAKIVKTNFINTIRESKVLSEELNKITEYKDIVLLHSLNTISLVIMIGLTLELSESDLIDLALTSLLLDISVIQIPKEQFDVHLNNKISTADFYNLHITELKRLTSKLPILRKESIIYGVIDHYEYFDGTGYPKRKKSSEISLFGRILIIAHSYEQMVGGYFLDNSTSPVEALQNIWDNRGTKFDPSIIRILLDRSELLKVGQIITIYNSKQATIIGFTDYIDFPFSPIVKLDDGSIVDLINIKK